MLLDDDPPVSPNTDLAQTLRMRLACLQERHAFAPGDLVTWKPGMANRTAPGPGRPALVIEVLAEPVFDPTQEAGRPYFREPLDIVLGLLIEEGEHRGDFITLYLDSRRLKPWQGEVRA